MAKRWLTILAVLAAGIVSAALAADTIKIGVQAPITGQYANEGQGIAKAVKLLVKQQNAKGGLLGKQLTVTVCDDEGQASQAAICARQLVNAGVIAVIGTYTSGAALAAEPVYARANVLQTSDGTSNKLTSHGYKTFFRNAPPNSAEAKFTADYLVNVKKYQNIVVISDHSSFGTGLADAVMADIKKDGGSVAYEGFITSGSQDFTAVLTKVKSLDPDVIYFSGYYTDGGLLRHQEVQLGIKADFVGGDANQNVDFAKLAGSAAAGTVIINVPPPEELPYPQAKQFLADYQKAYGEAPPSIYTLTNADGLRVIMKAIQETKSVDPSKLEDYLHGDLKNFPGFTGPISFSDTGERIGSAFQAFAIQPDGSYKTVYSAK
jgi:branched-chain amino acid transport system substrate-binding protein